MHASFSWICIYLMTIIKKENYIHNHDLVGVFDQNVILLIYFIRFREICLQRLIRFDSKASESLLSNT